jgi:alpha-galactosidase
MNTLSGDPTTEKLLPLIDSAAEAGAEAFCIDAGWYADDGNWWDTVGEWQPSTGRFPGGFDEVLDRIRDRGMIPGVWLEPEVIGVNSPMADRLPESAFFSRHGVRIREAGRYHLDLRHPAARDHLDRTVDRLVDELGVGMFKFDYNIDPGAGTDLGADSAGAGLLGHNRAHLSWLDGLLHRHPELIIENCSSGAMRCDFAVLSRLQLQSTSDQQDVARYVPIAASAPLQLLPEQAGSWAYPADWMPLEEVAATLQAGLLGRLYLSGHLNKLAPVQLALVRQAVAVHKELRTMIATAVPSWPLGLPGWDDPLIALRLTGTDSSLLTVWHRGESATEAVLSLPGPAITELELIFPADLPGWTAEVTHGGTDLKITAEAGPVSARTYRLRH